MGPRGKRDFESECILATFGDTELCKPDKPKGGTRSRAWKVHRSGQTRARLGTRRKAKSMPMPDYAIFGTRLDFPCPDLHMAPKA